jgi:hypothetical protein
MTRLTKHEALDILRGCGVDLSRDFHALDSETVERLVAAGKARGYRKSANAPGSYGRMFHAYLTRHADGKR